MTAVTSPKTTILDPLVIREGAVCGILGAIGIAVWFFIADLFQGQPFYTPSALGATLVSLLGGGAAGKAPVSFGMVFMFSLVHGITFVVIGISMSMLLHRAEGDPAYGFMAILLLLFFGCSFVFLNMVVAGVVLDALKITDILIANMAAAGLMGIYLWKCHPNLEANI